MAQARVTFRDVLRVREFRALWFADLQSTVGDQLARVALSILVFDKTGSSFFTALAYALTFLPAVLGGTLLAGLADRMPRRRVMIGCDLSRAVLLAIMSIPHSPIWLVCALLVLAVLLGSPFSAAEAASIADILEGDSFEVATGLRTITNQLSQLAGFAGGGIVVAVIGPRSGLAVDAGTFLLSSLLIRTGLRSRPRPTLAGHEAGESPATYFASMAAGLRFVATNSTLRTLLGLSWLLGLYVVPEGIASPYAAEIGSGRPGVGLLFAAGPLGTALGAYLFLRFVPTRYRSRWIGPLAVAGGVPLAVCAIHPGLIVSLVMWALSGACAAYQVQVVPEYVRAVPDGHRGQAIGVAASGLLAAQGIGILIGGVIASRAGPADAVAVAGGLAAVLGVGLTIVWTRISRTPGAVSAAS